MAWYFVCSAIINFRALFAVFHSTKRLGVSVMDEFMTLHLRYFLNPLIAEGRQGAGGSLWSFHS